MVTRLALPPGLAMSGYTNFIDAATATPSILTSNTAAQNASNLQTLINNNAANGAVIWFAQPVPMDPFTLKTNIHLQGNNAGSAFIAGPGVNGGGAQSLSATPAGASFLVTNTSTAFCSMQSGTSINGILIHYPNQNYSASTYGSLVTYPDTFVNAGGVSMRDVSLSNILVVGATRGIAFIGNGTTSFVSAIELDNFNGFCVGGTLIILQYVSGSPSISRCYSHPSSGWEYLGDAGSGIFCPFLQAILNAVQVNGAPQFQIDYCDDMYVAGCQVFNGSTAFSFTGSYGSLSQCMTDTVVVGYHVTCNSTLTSGRRMTFTACDTIPSGGVTAGNRNGWIFDGSDRGLLCLVGCNGTTTTSNAFLNSAGSGTQLVQINGCATGPGTWNSQVVNSNGSCTVTGTVATY